ncbi:MAG: Cys-Gln thioester bond-forming surface protein, partial [Bacilli bacterium]|nr:Cys-Gln thioester bond-forming surface protein [Bacilli bacterium]
MKYLKWILTLGVVALVLSTSNVYAQSDSFYEGELVEGAYLKKFKPGETIGKYEQMRIFRRSSDNQAAYCIELWSQLSSGQQMDGYTDDYAFHAKISNDTWEKIQLIAYYGYEYKDHTSDNWYAASQFLIWKTLEPSSTIYFTDTLNGNQVSKFEEEMREIENLVLKHRMLPSFVHKINSIDAFTSQHLFDTNQVMDNYTITTNDPVTFSKESDHSINITMDYIGTATFQLTREDTTRQTLLYVSPSTQNLIVRGNFPKITAELKVQVEAGKIIFRKIDKDTQETMPQGDASFLGTTYEIYTKNHKFKQIVEIKDNQPVIIEQIPYGVYFI